MKTHVSKDPVEVLYEEGRKTFIGLVPGGGKQLDALFHTAPALGKLAVGTVYGYLHSQPDLDPRLQEAAIFAAIVAAGMVGPPLSVHFKTSLAEGLAPGELTALLLVVSAFTGFPRAVATADQLNLLFANAGLPSPPPPAPRATRHSHGFLRQCAPGSALLPGRCHDPQTPAQTPPAVAARHSCGSSGDRELQGHANQSPRDAAGTGGKHRSC